MKEKIVILGSGGHARSVLDAIISRGEFDVVGAVSPQGSDAWYRGFPRVGSDEVLPLLLESGCRKAALGLGHLGDPAQRESLFSYAKSLGFRFPPIIDPTAIVAGDAEIGEGAFVGKAAVLNANASVGKIAIVNSGSLVEHDCSVADGAHVAVRSVLCGGVTVGAGSFVGANATVIQGVSIGAGAIVGAGAIILADIDPGGRAVGVYGRSQA